MWLEGLPRKQGTQSLETITETNSFRNVNCCTLTCLLLPLLHHHTCSACPAQAKDNLGAMGWRLTAAEVEELDRAAARVKKGMVQNIFQTK